MSQYFAVNVMIPDLALTFLKLRDDSRGPGHLVLTPCGTVMQRVFPATVNGWETWLLSSKLQVLPIGTYIRAQGPSLSHLDPHLSVKVTDYRVGGYCHFTTVCTLTSSGHEFNVLCPSLLSLSLSDLPSTHTVRSVGLDGGFLLRATPTIQNKGPWYFWQFIQTMHDIKCYHLSGWWGQVPGDPG